MLRIAATNVAAILMAEQRKLCRKFLSAFGFQLFIIREFFRYRLTLIVYSFYNPKLLILFRGFDITVRAVFANHF
jgi:hypothetical protein